MKRLLFFLILVSVLMFLVLFTVARREPQIDKSSIGYEKSKQIGGRDTLKHKFDKTFERVGYYKDSNKISTVRVFSVYAKELDYELMRKYSETFPWSQGRGVTYVLFFNDRENTPDVTFVGLDYSDKYEKYLVAQYAKYPNGRVDFVTLPEFGKMDVDTFKKKYIDPRTK